MTTEQPTTKIAAEWFKTVEHEGVRKMLLESWNKHTTGKVGYYEDVWTALFGSFDWRSTDQGYAIWESCHSSHSWQPAIDWWEQHYGKPESMPITTPTTQPDNTIRLQIAAQFMAARIRDWGEPNPSYCLNLADELIKASQL